MRTQAYFEKIHKHIEHYLYNSTSSIRIAVAWFTDHYLFDILCQKAKNGIHVELLIANHEINSDSSIVYKNLIDNNGKIYWIGKRGVFAPLMHNKFCIIDNKILIFGSYNWTQKAKSNHESITVIEEDYNLILDFNQEFDKIKAQYYKQENEIDWQKVTFRLNTLVNTIKLDDIEDIKYQINKTKNLIPRNSTDSKINNLSRIISLCENKKYEEAILLIEELTKEFKRITLFRDPQISFLKLEIKSLEIQVSCLEDEKIEIEKEIVRYNLFYNTHLGQLIKNILEIKRSIAKYEADRDKNNEKAQNKFKEADKEYDEFSKNYKENINGPKPIELNEEDRKEIKEKYRKATKLCHPDKVSEEQKQIAQMIFNDLKDAYEVNDLQKVRTILNQLEKGVFKSQGETIDEKNKLLLIKQELEIKRERLELILETLKNSDTYIKTQTIDDWNEHFLDLKSKFTQMLESLLLTQKFKV